MEIKSSDTDFRLESESESTHVSRLGKQDIFPLRFECRAHQFIEREQLITFITLLQF